MLSFIRLFVNVIRYFTLFGYNTVGQGLLLLQDLKLGQYAKLSPRCTFTMQMIGTLIGALLNYVLTITITSSQRDILLSIEGTHIWSGAVSYLPPSKYFKRSHLNSSRASNPSTHKL
jgi:hypothetical protein